MRHYTSVFVVAFGELKQHSRKQHQGKMPRRPSLDETSDECASSAPPRSDALARSANGDCPTGSDTVGPHSNGRSMTYHRSTPFILSNFLFTFYVLISFARPGTAAQHSGLIGVFFLVTILGLILARRLEDETEHLESLRSGKSKRNAVARLLLTGVPAGLCRVGLLASGVLLTIEIFWGLWGTLGNMIWEGGYQYIIMMSLMCIIAYRVQARLRRMGGSAQKRPVLILVAFTCFLLSYLAVLNFAARIYCYIPARKGGGDYTTEHACVLAFDPRASNAVPASLLSGSGDLVSKPVYLLRESSQSLYVCTADPNDNPPPQQWRLGGVKNKPKVIVAVKRDIVLGVTQSEWDPNDPG